MKTMIAMNNAMKFYGNSELTTNREAHKRNLSADLNASAFSTMLGKIFAMNGTTIAR